MLAKIHIDSNLERLTVSPDRRRLMTQDGRSFFWLADTAWELLHKLSREEASEYLRDRSGKEFNVIQTVVLAEFDGLRTPNFYGDLPLEDLDPARPAEGYFRHVDWVFDVAKNLGLYIALLPTWGDKVEQRYDWAKGPEIFTEGNAYVYGRFLAERYGPRNNVIWIIGGDRDPGEKAVAIWRAMALGIREGTPGDLVPLMTFHPQPFYGGSSSRWFHADDWLSFNMLQTGHDRDTPVYELIRNDYRRLPVKPVLDGEPVYEAHGLAFRPQERGYSTDADVRKSAYWSVFSGACGHTYGCHSIWQFLREGEQGINLPIYTWTEALQLAGASQMHWLRRLMESADPSRREPAQHVISGDNPSGPHYQCALRETSGRYVWVYTPTGGAVTIDGDAIGGDRRHFCWFSPRDGRYTVWTACHNAGTATFTPPNSGYGCDWVLILEAESTLLYENPLFQ